LDATLPPQNLPDDWKTPIMEASTPLTFVIFKLWNIAWAVFGAGPENSVMGGREGSQPIKPLPQARNVVPIFYFNSGFDTPARAFAQGKMTRKATMTKKDSRNRATKIERLVLK
jgi:hypothetical protein